MAANRVASVEALKDAIAAAVKAVWAGLGEDLYGLALFTSPSAEFVRVTAFSDAGLEATVARYAEEGSASGRDALRWSPADSPLHCRGDDAFASVDALIASEWAGWEHQDARENACHAALERLDAEGLFGAGEARARLALMVMQGDQSDRARLDSARRLNPPAVVARLSGQLRITEEVGVAFGLGRAYQIAAMDFAGGTLLASGSGGELLIWRWDERGEEWVAVEGAPQRGARWAAGLTPDGAGVYVSDGHTVQTAPIRKRLRTLTTFYESLDQVRCLRWSPDGGTLLVQTWGPTVALDWTGAVRWRSELAGPGAWTPDGAVVVGTDDGLVWLEGGEEAARRTLGAEPVAVAATRDAVAVSTGGGWSKKPVEVVILGESSVAMDCGGLPEVRALAFSPNGALLAGACGGGEVAVWSRAGDRLFAGRGRHEALGQVAWIDDATFVAAGRDVDRGPAVVAFTV